MVYNMTVFGSNYILEESEQTIFDNLTLSEISDRVRQIYDALAESRDDVNGSIETEIHDNWVEVYCDQDPFWCVKFHYLEGKLVEVHIYNERGNQIGIMPYVTKICMFFIQMWASVGLYSFVNLPELQNLEFELGGPTNIRISNCPSLQNVTVGNPFNIRNVFDVAVRSQTNPTISIHRVNLVDVVIEDEVDFEDDDNYPPIDG